jgi:hypothetical protein
MLRARLQSGNGGILTPIAQPQTSTSQVDTNMPLSRAQPQLFPELNDRIIDYLHDNIIALRTCALVCKAWVPSCRFHLFYTIRTASSYKDEEPRCRKLYDLVQRSSHIAFYIRELIIYGENNSILNLERVLIPLLRCLTELRTLGLDGVDWKQLTPDMRKSFAEVLARPSLIHFETIRSNFPDLEHFIALLHPHLKRLAIGNDWDNDRTTSVGSAIGNGLDAMSKQRPCRLDHLDLSVAFRNHSFAEWLLGPQSIIDLSSLRTLHVSFDSRSQRSTMAQMKLMRSLRSSLEHITIHVPDDLCRLCLVHPFHSPLLKDLTLHSVRLISSTPSAQGIRKASCHYM